MNRRTLAPCALLIVVACGGSHTGDPDAATAAGSDAPAANPACKRGVAYGHHSTADFAAERPTIAWWYDWTFLPDDALRDGSYRAAGVDYVPMVWGGTFSAATLIDQIPTGATSLLGFNEPNFGAQANLSAVDAAARWPQLEAVADARGLALISPAVNYCGGDCQDTDPLHYLDAFFAACAGCRVDAIAFHVYVGCHAPGAHPAQWLIDKVHAYEARFARPLWLTEFACTDAASEDDQVAFLTDAVDFLEHDPRIARYAWFSGRFAGIPFVDLLGADGELTALGRAYVAAPTDAACGR